MGLLDPGAAQRDHVGAFYRGPAERDRLMSAYLRDGLRIGHACLCVTGDESADMLSKFVGADMSSLDGSRSAAAGPMLRQIGDWSRATSDREDCSFARVVADMSWALPDGVPPAPDDIADYEAGVAAWTTSYPQSCVCMYDLERFGSVALAVIKAHPRVWMGGVMLENPYARGADQLAAACHS
jgi:hypothetical protein